MCAPSEQPNEEKFCPMQKLMKSKLAVLTVFTLSFLPVWSEVKVVLSAHKIVKADGAEQSISAD